MKLLEIDNSVFGIRCIFVCDKIYLAMIATNNKLTNIQLELIKMFKYNLDDSQLTELKELLSKYFADKIDTEMDKFWQQNEWTDKKIESIANQHTRTPYSK